MGTEAIKQDDGTFQNEAGLVVNEENHLIDDDGKLINEEGFLVNVEGQLLNDDGKPVDAEGNLVDGDGKLLDPPDTTMIPKSRYDSAARRAKDAETALAKSQADLAEANKNTDTSGGDPKTVADFEAKIDELDVKIEGARRDNDADAIARLSKEQRTFFTGMYTKIASDTANTAGTAAQQQMALDTLIDDLEKNHEEFNKDSGKFDQALVNEVLDMQGAFVLKGDTPASAMAKAVGYILPPAQANADGRTTDLKKNLDAAARQAAKLNGGKGSNAGGDDGTDKNIADMTQPEFDAMPEETKKRLRGDSYAAA